MLFEVYYYLATAPLDRKEYCKRALENSPYSDDEKGIILQKFGLPFAFFVASMALSRSAGRTKKPMFYLNLLDDYHGLSNRAVDARASYNTCLKLKHYKREKSKLIEESTAATKTAIDEGKTVAVCDNFNQRYWVSRVDAEKAGLQNRNRCAAGVSLLTRSISPNLDSAALTSLPRPELLLPFLREAMKEVELALENCVSPGTVASDFKYYEGAEVTVSGVYTVPLKLQEAIIKERGLPAHDIGLKNFKPLWIFDSDPASYRGFFGIIHRLYEDYEQAFRNGHFIMMRFDLNIYNMFLRVPHSQIFSFRATSDCIFSQLVSF